MIKHKCLPNMVCTCYPSTIKPNPTCPCHSPDWSKPQCCVICGKTMTRNSIKNARFVAAYSPRGHPRIQDVSFMDVSMTGRKRVNKPNLETPIP